MLTLHCGRAEDLFKLVPDHSVHAVICDPPYGVTRNKWDAIIPLDLMWQELDRILTPNGAAIFTASQPFTSQLVVSNLSGFRHEWIWRKNKASGHLNAKRAPMKAHESILVFAANGLTYTPQMELGHAPMNAYYTSHSGQNYGGAKVMAGGGSTQRYPKSVLDFAVVNNSDPEKFHPTQKPVSMLEYLVRTYTLEGHTVLDFAMGSGSTGEACLNTGREFIGFELEEDMFQLAKQRLEKHSC